MADKMTKALGAAFSLIERHPLLLGKMIMDEELLQSFEETTAPGIRKFATWVTDESGLGWWEVNLPRK